MDLNEKGSTLGSAQALAPSLKLDTGLGARSRLDARD